MSCLAWSIRECAAAWWLRAEQRRRRTSERHLFHLSDILSIYPTYQYSAQSTRLSHKDGHTYDAHNTLSSSSMSSSRSRSRQSSMVIPSSTSNPAAASSIPCSFPVLHLPADLHDRSLIYPSTSTSAPRFRHAICLPCRSHGSRCEGHEGHVVACIQCIKRGEACAWKLDTRTDVQRERRQTQQSTGKRRKRAKRDTSASGAGTAESEDTQDQEEDSEDEDEEDASDRSTDADDAEREKKRRRSRRSVSRDRAKLPVPSAGWPEARRLPVLAVARKVKQEKRKPGKVIKREVDEEKDGDGHQDPAATQDGKMAIDSIKAESATQLSAGAMEREQTEVDASGTTSEDEEDDEDQGTDGADEEGFHEGADPAMRTSTRRQQLLENPEAFLVALESTQTGSDFLGLQSYKSLLGSLFASDSSDLAKSLHWWTTSPAAAAIKRSHPDPIACSKAEWDSLTHLQLLLAENARTWDVWPRQQSARGGGSLNDTSGRRGRTTSDRDPHVAEEIAALALSTLQQSSLIPDLLSSLTPLHLHQLAINKAESGLPASMQGSSRPGYGGSWSSSHRSANSPFARSTYAIPPISPQEVEVQLLDRDELLLSHVEDIRVPLIQQTSLAIDSVLLKLAEMRKPEGMRRRPMRETASADEDAPMSEKKRGKQRAPNATEDSDFTKAVEADETRMGSDEDQAGDETTTIQQHKVKQKKKRAKQGPSDWKGMLLAAAYTKGFPRRWAMALRSMALCK